MSRRKSGAEGAEVQAEAQEEIQEKIAEAAAETEAEQEKIAEQLETEGVITDEAIEAPKGGANVVYVFANLPNAQSFKLGDGKVITITGMPISKLKTPGGGFFAGGKYGVTVVENADDWKEVVRIYGNMSMFKNGIIFAASSLEEGKVMARRSGSLRHSFEPVDPGSKRTKSKPHDGGQD